VGWKIPWFKARSVCRMIPIKTEREVDKMRAAGRSAATVLDRACALVRPGVTTGEIDRAAAEFMVEEGCVSAFLGYRGFPGRICISVNEEVVHGIGGERKIQYGDVVKLDVGVIKDGWVGDTARTVGAGALDVRLQRLLQVTQQTLMNALQFAVAGRRLGDLCCAIEEEILANGYTVVKEFVGHGVGRKLHEEPQVPNFGRRGTGPKLKAGMTLAIEPMVNLGVEGVRVLSDKWTVVTLDGKPSAHFEHTVLVTGGEPEILTQLRGEGLATGADAK
jgi:methionyl aminopeptidase